MVNLPIQSALKTVAFNKRKSLYNKIPSMFDQAINFNTNTHF